MSDNGRILHVWDDDACCEVCGFDGAEAHWLRSQTPPECREPCPDYEIYCETAERKRRMK